MIRAVEATQASQVDSGGDEVAFPLWKYSTVNVQTHRLRQLEHPAESRGSLALRVCMMSIGIISVRSMLKDWSLKFREKQYGLRKKRIKKTPR